MTFDEVLQEQSERETLIEMIDDLIDLIESADKVEELFTERFYEIKKYINS